MDVIDWLLAKVEASGVRKKTIAQEAGLRDASALSRILHRKTKPRLHQLEAIAAAIDLTLSSYYESARPPVGVKDAREALRVLSEFVEQQDAAKSKPEPVPNASEQVKPNVSRKSARSRTVKPFHAAANPNAILLGGDDDED